MSALVRLAPRLLLGFSALCLASGASVHTLAYQKAAGIAEHSTLPAFFVAAFKGLWLSDSLTCSGLALTIGAIAVFPRMASRSLVMLLAVMPLASAMVILATMGKFFAGYVMLLSSVTTLVGGALHRSGSRHAVESSDSA